MSVVTGEKPFYRWNKSAAEIQAATLRSVLTIVALELVIVQETLLRGDAAR